MNETTFKVGTRQITGDLSSAGVKHNARVLGPVPATRFSELLLLLAGLPLEQIQEADPHLVVAARRGRFLIRPSAGKLRLFDASDASRAILELTPADVPGYLEGVHIGTKTSEERNDTNIESGAKNSCMGVVRLMVLSVLSLAASVYFTFQPVPIDPDVNHTAISAPVQVTSLRDQFVGEYSTGKGAGSRILTIRSEGTLTLFLMVVDNNIMEKRDDSHQVP